MPACRARALTRLWRARAQLPTRFLQCVQTDLPACDTLIVMGTSLAVQPFASLVGMVPAGATRLLINRERVGERTALRGGFEFERNGARDLFFQGDCDEGVQQLVDGAGWREEFDAMAAAEGVGAARAGGA